MKPRVTAAEVDLVYEALRYCRGEARAERRGTLRTHLGLSDRRLRAAIHALITERRLPVCSSANGRGYYVPATAEELERAVRFIEAYRDEVAERARCLREAFVQFAVEQLRLGIPA